MIGEQQLIKAVDKLVEVTASNWCRGLRLPGVSYVAIKPLVMQIQEPKMKVVPSSSTVLVKLKDAIEFSGGCSMNNPTQLVGVESN
jgi:hypothetical protein